MTTQQFTVFFSDGGFQHNEADQGEFSGVGVSEIIAFGTVHWPHCAPVAWAPEWPSPNRGTKVLRAESIAAGRLIEKVDGKWVALGAEKQEATVKPHGSDQGDLIHRGGREYVRAGAGFRWYSDLPDGAKDRFFAGSAEIERLVVAAECAHLQSLQKSAAHDPGAANAAMIARDLPIHITENGVAKVKAKDVLSQPQVRKDLEKVKELRTTHPNPFAAFRSPDFTNGPADHLNAARHQMAGMKG